jgi:hypothetical protein
MRKIKVVIALLMALTILMAGCLGGGEEDGDNTIEYVEARGTWATEGNVATEESGDPVSVTEAVTISLPEDNLTSLNIDIKIMEASGDYDDSSTNPDEATGSLDDTGGGYNITLKKSFTPYSDTHSIKSQEGISLPAQWTLTLDVTCNPSDDRWPGPLIISVYPDHGFSYNVSITYAYLKPAET